MCTWIQVGYTSDRLIGAWQQVFAKYAQIFPRQYFSLALYPPPPIVSTTRCQNGNTTGTNHSESQRVRAVIVGLGADKYPEQFVLQMNGLTAAKEDTSNLGGYDLVKSYSGKVGVRGTLGPCSSTGKMFNVSIHLLPRFNDWKAR